MNFPFALCLRLCLLISLLSIPVFSDTTTILNLAPDTWYAAPGTKMRPVCAPNAGSGCWSVIATWSGGVYNNDRNEMAVWGGGHNDYYGNELYAFNFNSLTWRRVTNPSPYNANPQNCGVEVLSDGNPNSRHTYNGLAYISHAQRFFGIGGALACGPGGCGANITWTFNFGTDQWSRMNPSGANPSTDCGNNCAYDPVNKKVYLHVSSGWYAYDFTANSWAKLNSAANYYYRTSCIDTKRRRLVEVGQGLVTSYNLDSPVLAAQILQTTGAPAIVSGSNAGVDYDPVNDRVVAWAGGAVYSLNMDTRVWTAQASAGAPPPTQGQYYLGIYGRWRYVPPLKAFALVVDVDSNVYFYKNKATPGAVEAPLAPAVNDKLRFSPNPVAGKTQIQLDALGKSLVEIFDERGRKIGGWKGLRRITWDASNVPAGVYLVRAGSGGKVWTLRVVVIR